VLIDIPQTALTLCNRFSQSKRLGGGVGIAMEQLSMCIPVTSLLKRRHRSNRRVGAANTKACHDAGLRITDDIVC
jgi:hypothetical protein